MQSKTRFNIIDVIILLFVTALISLVFLRNNIINTVEEKQEITYTFKINSLERSRLNCLTEENEILIESGEVIGKIISVDFEIEMIEETLVNGNTIKVEHPGYYNVIVQARGSGFETLNGYYLNDGIYISPGIEYKIISNNAVFEIIIDKIG